MERGDEDEEKDVASGGRTEVAIVDHEVEGEVVAERAEYVWKEERSEVEVVENVDRQRGVPYEVDDKPGCCNGCGQCNRSLSQFSPSGTWTWEIGKSRFLCGHGV